MKKIIVGLTGASGSILFKRTVEELLRNQCEVYIISTNYGEQVFHYEIGITLEEFINSLQTNKVILCDPKDMFSPVASGSFDTDGMIIVPCSMGTIGKIAHGTSDNLLIRCADVQIKEKRKLIIVPREAPLSSIHLENLLTLSRNNAYIIPPVPSFYNKPESIEVMIDQMVGRIISYFDLKTNLKKSWNGKKEIT